MTVLPIRFLRLGVAAIWLAGVSLHSQSAAEQSAHLAVRLQARNVGAANTRVELRIRVAPGWHIGDREPGDTGLPTRITWILPGGMARDEGDVAHAKRTDRPERHRPNSLGRGDGDQRDRAISETVWKD